MLKKLLSLVPVQTVHAHCDIPCGVYTAEGAKTAALAVLRMAQKINDLDASATDWDTRNNFVRMVRTKEREAQRCKEEMLILWTDYFKEEHLEMFPALHETFWKAAKQCSKAKQSASVEEAQKLVETVNLVADAFAKAEAAKKS